MDQNRAFEILDKVIQEYIKTGEPVSSKWLEEKNSFDLKSASIRNELNKLTKAGYLTQAHTSGGRIPTDRGYEFFVSQKIEQVDFPEIEKQVSRFIANFFGDGIVEDFIEDFSKQLGILGIGYEYNKKDLYHSGLDELFEHLEVGSHQDFYEIARDFENLPNQLESKKDLLLEEIESGPKVFIGQKSPITKSPQISVIVDSYQFEDQPLLLIAIGPKRMDYQKTLKLMKQIKGQPKTKNQHGKFKRK